LLPGCARNTISFVEAGAITGRVLAPRRWELNLPRVACLVVLTAAATAFLAYMVGEVPLTEAKLSREEAHRFWAAALIGALIVLAGTILVVSEVLRARRAGPSEAVGKRVAAGTRGRAEPLVPRSLRFERVPGRVVALAAAYSALGLGVAFILGVPLWIGGLAFALPWVPLIAIEARWKYATYGIFAGFALLCLMQVAHMGEHSMQVGQLLVHQGDLTVSHGVFGQLDFELVHFVTDTTLWIILGLLLIIYRGKNVWLWVAFGAASLHQVEHFYLFWMYQTHESFYAAGGFAGIMGESGMIGSPLDRPYLHFTYNFIVVVPMLLALWDEARRVDRQRPRRPPKTA
jgi:hypothetical protein